MRGSDVLAVAAVGALVFMATMLAFRARNVTRLRRRLEPHMRLRPTGEQVPKTARRRALAPLYEATERAFARARFWRRITAALERADWSMTPAQFFYLELASALGPAFLFALAGAPGILVVLAIPLGGLVPAGLLRMKGSRRQRAFDEQLPQLLMTMAASVRVGHSFRQAMQSIVNEGVEPASKEFGRVLVETDLGRPVDQALAEMAQRLGSENFKYVIQAVSIQREAGGSLGDLFDLVAETVRHRQQFIAKVRALTAMGRLSAYILAVLPFAAVALLSAINTKYTKPLFDNSTGHMLLIIAATGIVIGFVILRKITSFRLS